MDFNEFLKLRNISCGLIELDHVTLFACSLSHCFFTINEVSHILRCQLFFWIESEQLSGRLFHPCLYHDLSVQESLILLDSPPGCHQTLRAFILLVNFEYQILDIIDAI